MTIDWFLQCNISLDHHLPIIVFLQIRSTSHSFQLKLNSTSVKLKIQMSSLNSLLLIECYCWGFVIVESSKMIICWIVVDVLTDGIISFVEIFISPGIWNSSRSTCWFFKFLKNYFNFIIVFDLSSIWRSRRSNRGNPVLRLDLQQSSDAEIRSLAWRSVIVSIPSSARQSPENFFSLLEKVLFLKRGRSD